MNIGHIVFLLLYNRENTTLQLILIFYLIGYDTRVKEWLTALLPLSIKLGVKIITNMGAADPIGAGRAAEEIAKAMGVKVRIGVVAEVEPGLTEPDGVGCTHPFILAGE